MGSFPIARRTEDSAVPHLDGVFRRPRVTDAVSGGVPFHRWKLGFKQCSLHHIARVSRYEDLSVFGTPTASTACECPLWLSPPGKPLTQECSSGLLLSTRGI